MNYNKKYNWTDIQNYYNLGHSWREIMVMFGVSMRGIQMATKRNDFISHRTFNESVKLANKKKPKYYMSEEKRFELSKTQSEKNRGGRSKWFDVNGIKVQGTWERNFALLLCNKNINWRRGTPLKYCIDGKNKHYTPDFYLPDYDLNIEIKGYWWGSDKRKIDCIIQQYPNIKLTILEDDKIFEDFLINLISKWRCIMSDDGKYKVIIQPGVFDFFEGTQEELDQLMETLTKGIEDGSFFENSQTIDMELLAEEDPKFYEHLQKQLDDLDTDRNKKLN